MLFLVTLNSKIIFLSCEWFPYCSFENISLAKIIKTYHIGENFFPWNKIQMALLKLFTYILHVYLVLSNLRNRGVGVKGAECYHDRNEGPKAPWHSCLSAFGSLVFSLPFTPSGSFCFSPPTFRSSPSHHCHPRQKHINSLDMKDRLFFFFFLKLLFQQNIY